MLWPVPSLCLVCARAVPSLCPATSVLGVPATAQEAPAPCPAPGQRVPPPARPKAVCPVHCGHTGRAAAPRGARAHGDLLLCRGAEILFSLALAHARRTGTDGRYPVADYALLSNARRNLGLFQHHDAITGTAKEAVAVDYGSRCVQGPARGSGGLVGTGLGLWLCVGSCGAPLPGAVGGTLGQDATVMGGSLCLCPRLLHSLTNLKRVIINAAHYLVLGDKNTYHHDPAAPFLGMVSSTCPVAPCALAHQAMLRQLYLCLQGEQPCLPVQCWAVARGRGPSLCQCSWVPWRVPPGSDCSSLQDDMRTSQDSLPEKTVVKLGALPR